MSDCTCTPEPSYSLIDLAQDIVDGKVFTSQQVRDPKELSLVFIPLSFLEGEMLEQFKSEEPRLLWAPMERALPTSVNGMPCFAEMHVLGQKELDVLEPLIAAAQEIKRLFLKSAAS